MERIVRRTCLALLTSLSPCAGWASAWAQDDATPSLRVALEWDDRGVPVCMTQPELEASVRALLGRSAFGQLPADVIVQGSLIRSPDGSRTARLALTRPDGTGLGVRELKSSDPGCRSLREGIPIALSLMIDTRRSEVRLLLPKSEPPSRPEVAPPVSTPRAAEPMPPTVQARNGVLEVGASVERGLLPGTTFASRIAGAWVQPSGWALRVHAGFEAPHFERFGDGGATVWAWQVGAGASLPLLSGTRGAIEAAALLETGQMLSRGSGFDTPQSAGSWLLEGLAGGRGLLKLGRGWAVGAAGWGGVPMVKQRITYQDPQGVFALSTSSHAMFRGEVFVGFGYF